ncbi:MAG: glycoside hydrolase family 13 protein [Candidatus Limnocylindrales bacterium]
MSIETPGWVREAVFYQVFPDRFARSGRVPAPGPLEPWAAPPTAHGIKGGDLPGITDRLDALAELGISALYLNPIGTSASNHRYHPDDYFTVDPLLGGEAALRELLDAAHARGMHVILDGVFNHTGRGFLAFHHVLENGVASPYRDWYHLDQERLASGRPLVAYPPELPGGDGEHPSTFERLGYEAWWGLPALPKLDHRNPLVRDHLMQAAEHWIRLGADGWRLDVPEEIQVEGFWQEFRRRVKAVNPDAYIVAEIWVERPERLQGDQFDALMNYPLTEALLGFVSGRHLDLGVVQGHGEYRAHVRPLDAPAFAAALDRILHLYDPAVTAVQFNLLGSHDTPRFVTACGGDRASLRLATLVQMTLPGAPCIYYGDEVGLEGGLDPDNRRAFPTDPAAWDHGLRAFIAGAVALRRRSPTLRDRGAFRSVAAAGACHVHLRHDPASGELYLIAVNAGEQQARVELVVPELGARALRVEGWAGWPNETGARLERDGEGRIWLEVPARDGRVLSAA